MSKKLIKKEGEYYLDGRLFDAYHSKLAAAMKNGLKNPIKSTDVVLYLGASHGYTVSFIAGMSAFVFAVEFSQYVIDALISICQKTGNIAPILADAFKPSTYFRRVSGVDVVYQDIAQKNQVEIFVKNIELFLKKGGYGMLAVKCRSIDVAGDPAHVFEIVKLELEKHLKIVSYTSLEPFEKDHYFVIVKK